MVKMGHWVKFGPVGTCIRPVGKKTSFWGQFDRFFFPSPKVRCQPRFRWLGCLVGRSESLAETGAHGDLYSTCRQFFGLKNNLFGFSVFRLLPPGFGPCGCLRTLRLPKMDYWLKLAAMGSNWRPFADIAKKTGKSA